MKALLILLATAAFHIDSYAQTLTGKVTDAATQEPLAYVHIGVLYRNMGVISREDGTFSIDLSSARPDDQLVFSIIGYESRKMEISNINESSIVVKLIPKVYQLKEVTIKAGKIKDPIRLGRYQTTKTTTGQSGKDEYGFGGEWGLEIFNDGKKYKILDARFHLRYNTVDSTLFRVQVYSVKNDLPHESLLSKEVFVKSYKKDNWIVCGLEDQYLVMDQNVIVTYEVVRFWPKKGADNQFFLTHGSGYERGQAYSRSSSHDAWKVNQSPRVVLCLGVDELPSPKK